MKKTIFKLFTILAGCALLLTACKNVSNTANNTASKKADKSDKKTYVTISLNAKFRTALPQVTADSFVKFTLTGEPKSGATETVSWATADDSENPNGELRSAQVMVVKDAIYKFTLQAITANGTVYEDSCEKKIEAEGNTLTFKLSLVSLGTSGNGDAEISLKLPIEPGESDSKVKKVTVTVYPVIDDVVSTIPYSPELTEKTLTLKNGKAIFDSGSLPAGSYKAIFTLWNSAASDAMALDTWSEFFAIAGGLTSKSTMSNDGTNDDGTSKQESAEEQKERTFTLDFNLGDDEGSEQGKAQ